MEQVLGAYHKYYCYDASYVNIAGSHPGNDEDEDLPTKGIFKIGFQGFAQFEIREFRNDIEGDNH